MRAIIDRFSNYRRNLGTAGFVWNLLIVLLLVHFATTFRSPMATALLVAVFASGAILGLAIIPIHDRSPAAASHIQRATWWLLLACCSVNFFNVSPAPVATVLGVFFLACFVLSANFWIMSSPGVMSTRAYKAMLDQIKHELTLREIEENDDHPDPTVSPTRQEPEPV